MRDRTFGGRVVVMPQHPRIIESVEGSRAFRRGASDASIHASAARLFAPLPRDA